MGWILLGFVVVALLIIAVLAARRRSDESGRAPTLPYIKQETLLTAAERSFLGVLEQAAGDRFRIYAQVRLADLLAVKPGTDRAGRAVAQNRINAKHADFVLCKPDTLEIVCAIELDDASHQKANRRERDAFVEQACAAAGLPLARFPVKAGYVVADVRAEILRLLGTTLVSDVSVESPVVPSVDPAPSGGPACPKCGAGTVLRTVKSGTHAGGKLWGCSNYPSCRGFVPAGSPASAS